MAWRLAPTLVQLRSEVNAEWPLRDKTSDGTLGNAAHQGGKSDHNPDSRGVVCAMDFDEDLNKSAGKYPSFRPGQGARAFVDRLLALAKAGKLPQLYYVIYERQIFSRTNGFRARRYSGTNAHDHHAHVSVYHPAALADRRTPWGIGKPSTPDEGDDMPSQREIAEAVWNTDGIINNKGFAPGSAGNFVSAEDALLGILRRAEGIQGPLIDRLKTVETKLDALTAAVARLIDEEP